MQGHRWLAGALVVDALIVLVALVTSSDIVVAGAFVVPPFIVALRGSVTETIVAVACSVVLTILTVAFLDSSNLQWVVPAAVVPTAGAVAVAAAVVRQRLERDAMELELLADVASVADGRMGLDETVRRITALVVPRLADICAIDAVEPDGEPRRISVVAHERVPEHTAVEGALLRRKVVPVGSTQAARTGKRLITKTPDDVLQAIAASPEDLRALRASGITVAINFPLRARGRVTGVLSLCLCEVSGRHPTDRLVRFSEILAGRVALALDNAGLSAELTGVERRLDAILENLDEAVTVQDPSGRTTFVNAAAVRLLGLRRPEEAVDAEPGALLSLFDVFHADGRPVDLSEFPSSRLLRGEPAEPLLVRNVVRATGQERWLIQRASPVLDDDGSLALVVNVIEDVTTVTRTERDQRLLAEAGRLLASSHDYAHTLEEVARLAVPEFADWCGVDLPTRDGLEQVALAHADPEKVELGLDLRRRYPPGRGVESGIGQVLATGVSVLEPAIPDTMLAEAADDAEHLELLRQVGCASVMIVAMRAGPRIIGVLTFVDGTPGRFGERELALAEELGRRAGSAVANARISSERAEIAHTLQASLLPRELPRLEGWDLASFFRPVGDANDVGGDFLDGARSGDAWTIVLGDVAGKGARAAALTSLARHTLRTAERLTGDTRAALRELNAALADEPELALCTAVCARLPTSPGRVARVLIACAGHPRPVLVRGGVARYIDVHGPLLGSYLDVDWTEVEVLMEPDDILVLFTDGVMDVVGEDGERFGEERVLEALQGVRSGYAGAALAALDRAMDTFATERPRDDSAALAVAWVGATTRWSETVPGDESAPAAARALLRRRVGDRLDPAQEETALLLISELVTNAVRHGGASPEEPIRVLLRVQPERLRVEVHDAGPGFAPEPIEPGAHGGFGLRLLADQADEWGVDRDDGTTVWFEVRLAAVTGDPPGPACGPVDPADTSAP